MTPEIRKLRAKEAAIKKRIAEIQSRTKSEERKQRTSRLIRWGVVVEASLKAGEIEEADWAVACKKHLSERDQKIALSKTAPSTLVDGALKEVQPVAGTSCAPAADGDA
ncbi:MAG: hypothetical protein Q7S46_08495 [Gallionella sp.]|nr:hypothetical protein [Gallionella sp.]